MKARQALARRRGWSALLGLSLALSAGSLRGATFVRGDLTSDGQVTLADLYHYYDILLLGGPPPLCTDSADLNDNGVIDLQGTTDYGLLEKWLLGGGGPPKAPFPLPGVDPTQDSLPCDASSGQLPPVPGPGYSFGLVASPYLKRGSIENEVFLEVSTESAISAFSLAYHFDRRVYDNLRVDLKGTSFPSAKAGDFASSPFFRQEIVPRPNDPRYDALLVSVIYIEPLEANGLQAGGDGAGAIAGQFQKIDFAATQGPIQKARLLRIVFDVPASAPVGEAKNAFTPLTAVDYVSGGPGILHGLRNELIRGFGDPSRWGVVLSIPELPLMEPLAWDAGEFLRADANSDHCVDLSDARYTLSYLFLGGPGTGCQDAMDANDDGRLDVSDGVYTLSYLFSGGPAPIGPPPLLAPPGTCWFDDTGDPMVECDYLCAPCPRG